MDSNFPVHWIFGVFEIGEESDGDFEGREFAQADGGEAVVGQGGGQGIGREAGGEGLRLEGSDAAAERGGGAAGGEGVPGYE